MKDFLKKSILPMLFFLMLPLSVFAQGTVTGKVARADDGTTIPFVNIVEEGTSNGTVSDIDGNYSLTVSSFPATLVFSSLGFETTQQQVTGAGAINVSLNEEAAALDEVVVTGLATSVKRTNSANAVASLSSEEITGTTPPPTLDGALYGSLPVLLLMPTLEHLEEVSL